MSEAPQIPQGWITPAEAATRLDVRIQAELDAMCAQDGWRTRTIDLGVLYSAADVESTRARRDPNRRMWYPLGVFPANSTMSEHIKEWVGDRDWMGLGPDLPDDPGVPPVFVSLGKSEDGRLICTGLIIGEFGPFSFGTRELTARALRQIKIPELIEFVRQAESQNVRARELIESAPEIRRKPRGKGDAFLREVAERYRQALEIAPSRPTAHLSKLYDRPPVTIRRWLKQAEREGLLGKRSPGKAGELPAE